MIGTNVVVLMQSLLKDDDWIADEEMGEMIRKQFVDPVLHQLSLDIFVQRHVVVIIFWSIRWILVDVAIDRVVSRLWNLESVILQGLRKR